MSNDKQAQIQQYQNMDWDRVERQLGGMTSAEQHKALESLLASVPVPPGASRNQAYEVDYIAQQTGTENFDEIAERITLESDRRIKKSIKKNGDYDYYLWFRSPLTKFRGFWGTLLITYWLPALLVTAFVSPVLYLYRHDLGVLGGILGGTDGVTPFDRAHGGLWFVLSAVNVFVLFWIVEFNRANWRSFWMARMTKGKTANGVYAHTLMLFAAAIFVFAIVMGFFMALMDKQGGVVLGVVYDFVTSSDSWREVPEVFAITWSLWIELFSESAKWTLIFALFPTVVLLGFASMGAGPSVFALYFLKRELLNRFFRNFGFSSMAQVIDKLESRGEFLGGVRRQGMLRLKLAWVAEQNFGTLLGLTFGLHIIILVILAFCAAIAVVFM